jgi:Domain of unknown function (DUF4139)/N-terminal domain of unknown function (DUF4140)
MTASFWLVAGLACAQLGSPATVLPANIEQNAEKPVEDAPAPRPAASKIVAVTVYKGQALVTREVSVPVGNGVVELVVTPLPAQTVDSSLYTEGTEGLRVLSTRFRTRAVKEDTRQEVRAKEELVKKLVSEAMMLEKEIEVHGQDLRYLQKLEGFTGATLTSLTEQGRLNSKEILTLSKFLIENRGTKSKAEVSIRQQLQANSEATEFAKRQLTELSSGISRVERDAVIVVQKSRPEAGTVRLGHLVGAANWWPQYRLRGAADDAPVRLEYLAAVVQQTGEAWPDVRVTLSTARPSLDAAPPELLPLKLDVVDAVDTGPTEAHDDRSQKVANELGKFVSMNFPNDTPLNDVVKYIEQSTVGPAFPQGIPIYVDPQGLQDADKTMASTIAINLEGIPLRTSLRLLLKQLSLIYHVRDGLLIITSTQTDDDGPFRRDMGGMGGGMGGMGFSLEQAQASGAAMLNRTAATDQAAEMRVEGAPATGVSEVEVEKDGPSVSFTVAGTLGIPSRRDPQLLEVGRLELPAEYYAKAVPVLTPRVYRLAKLTNKSDLVLLPGEATAYVGGEFVGRMKLPLVAAGEPFIVGFGADPQLQVSRRLVQKTRVVQGGNQVYSYEFRIGLRNYRPGPVKVQLWDRLPTAAGESLVVNLVKTSTELSADPSYLRTARKENLLRWDLEVPQGTVGDKTMYLNYEFRLEYARDLPQPRFISGGLREGPIGGGAMGMGGGMGGMGGAFR